MKKLLLIPVMAILVSCAPKAAHLQHPDWAPDVLAGLNDFMDMYGHPSEASYAVFDFDNTTAIFDIEENQMNWQLENMAFEMDPERLREAISTDLDLASGVYDGWIADVSAAYEHLWNEYGPFTWRGLEGEALEAVRKDPMWQELGGKMYSMYEVIYAHESPTICYNWTKFWATGMTDAQLDSLSVKTHTICSSQPTVAKTWKGSPDIKSAIGPVEFGYEIGTGVTDNLRELWKTLRDNGIDVWVCSASGTRQVLMAVDVFGLHDYCTGVLAMTVAHDEQGHLTNRYDYETGHAFLALPGGGWQEDTLATKCQTCGPGKVTSIMNAIAPKYGGRGPVACFMDSTGDFNFCTEFSSLKAVLCFNRGNRKVTDGGGLIAEVAIYERDVLGYDLKKANEAGDIFYMLQGRDDNGMRSLRPSNSTVVLGETEERLFANENNYAQYQYFVDNKMSVRDILEKFCIKTPAEDSPLGFKYGFLNSYDGYRSK